MKQNAWLWYLAAVVAVGQYYFVSSVSSSPTTGLYTALGVSAFVAVLAGLFIHRPQHVLGWVLIAASIGFYLAGDYVFASLQENSAFVAVPSSADWLYLAMYPLLIAGIVMVRRSATSNSLGCTIDGAIAGAASFAVLGVLYMNDYFVDDTFGRSAQMVASAYPLLDVVVVAVAAWLIAGAGRRSATLGMVAVAGVVLVVGNAVYNAQLASFSYESGGVADLCWIAFVCLLGAAALHPSIVSSVEHGPSELGQHRSMLSVHGAMLAAIPIAHVRWGSGDDLTFIVPAGLIAAGLTVWRHTAIGAHATPSNSTIAVA